ncbi:MAG: hypothetical protein ABIG31_01380 [Candidatus Omnitrophota bacterium]
MIKMKYRLNKYHFIVVSLVIICLLLAFLFMLARLKILKGKSSKNIAMLEEVLPGFNEQSLEQFKRQIQSLKMRLVRLAAVLDPKDRWLKKDYDLTIHFVEELGSINAFLRSKAIEKKTNFPDIVFKEKLPSEREAFYLLSQLYGIKEVVSLAIDYNITIKSITPLGIEDVKGVSGLKVTKSNVELACPATGLIEFIIELNDILPKPFIEAVSLKSEDSIFDVNVTISNIVIDLPWKDQEEFKITGSDAKGDLSPQDQDSIRTLRNSNPFFIPQVVEPVTENSPAVKTEPAPGPRFLFRGKARLKSKEVLVIEDTLKKETTFLSLGDRIGNFILKEFSGDQAVLENTQEGKIIIIKQEEK